MITTPSDYEEKLWELQSNAPTQTAILLPKDEKIFEVNLNTRKINVPKFLSLIKVSKFKFLTIEGTSYIVLNSFIVPFE